MEIDELPGIGPSTVNKLREQGFLTVEAIAAASIGNLKEAGIGNGPAAKLIKAAQKAACIGFMTGEEYMEKRKQVGKITTCSNELNNLLGGGVETQAITELFGEFGSGKTQIAHQLAVAVQLPVEKGGLGGTAAYIDTESTFRGDRIISMAKALGLDPTETLKNIITTKAYNSDHQMLLVDKTVEEVAKRNIRLVIIDSVTAHFRAEFTGRGELATRQQKLNRYLHDLQRKLADNYNIAVLLTNQVMANPGLMFGDPTTPVGGHVLAHFCVGTESLILTQNGLKRIDQLTLKDKIYNGNKFINILSKGSVMNEEAFEIRANGIIIATAEHKFPVFVNGKIVDKKVKDLNVGDLLISTKKINISSELTNLNTKAKKLACLSSKCSKKIKESLKGRFKVNKELEEFTGITIRQLRRIINQSYPTDKDKLKRLITYALNRDITDFDFKLVYTNKHKNVRLPNKINKTTVRLFAAWLCDADKRDKHLVRIKKDSKDYLEYLAGIITNEYGLKTSLTKIKNKNCYQLVINSVKLVRMLKNIDINKLILLDNELILEFCAAMIDGNDSICKTHITFSQVNIGLINILQMLLLKLGIQSTIRREKQNNNFNVTQFCFSLNILSPGNHILIDAMKNKLKTNRAFGLKQNKKIPIITHAIKDIIPVGIKEVIDITVEGDYFLCNGIITHNSTFRIKLRKSKGISRVAKLIDSPNLPNCEVIFSVSEDGIRDI